MADSTRAMSDREFGAEKSAEPAERAALLRQLNAEIRGVRERFPEDDDPPLEFYCECGCWQTVELTMSEYDSLQWKPVSLPGHGSSAAHNGTPRTG